MSLKGKVCVVTGASRGVGRGVALALGAAGATVYVTGRSTKAGDAPLPGTVFETADLVTQGGGKGIAVVCDHGDDAQVAALFERVRKDSGRLDLLVHCAITIPDGVTDVIPFHKKPLAMVDFLDVGLRSNYVASYYAAPLLAETGGSLMVHISSPGGRCYMHGPAYGAGKAGVDKMAHDMAHDLRGDDVAVVSLWLGVVKTERTLAVAAANPEQYGPFLAMAETPEFEGRVIAALYADPKRMERSGKVHYTSELALEYGIVDAGGVQPPSHRGFLGEPTTFSDAVVG